MTQQNFLEDINSRAAKLPPVVEVFSHRLFANIPRSTLREFRDYHRRNLWIFDEFKRLAYQMLIAGRAHYSAKAIMEAVRWDYDRHNPGKEFKVCNDFTAYYARLLAVVDHRFETFFHFKTVRGLSTKEAA